MDKKQLEEDIKKQVTDYENESGFKVDWVNITRKNPVGFNKEKEITAKVKILND